ncbi:MAG: hypothetical protein ACFFHV_04380 [Promethearchaeota archaeon]
MNEIFFIFLVIGYTFSLMMCLFSIYSISIHYTEYGTALMAILNILIIFFTGFIYSTIIFFSIVIYPSVLLWKLSIITGFISLGIYALFYAFLYEYKKIPVVPFLCYTTLFGLLIGFLFFIDSVQLVNNSSNHFFFLIIDISNIHYIFIDGLAIIITTFLFFFGVYFLYFSIKTYLNSRNKHLTKWLIFNTALFSLPTLMYFLYIYLRLNVFRELHIITLWVNLIGVIFMLIKKPEIFLILTNKIYNINIYHKSGILLYSYKFEKEKPISDSAIWGNILIGLNHILSEFVDKKDKIDVMKTENLDIVVNYNIDYGFAVLVITNQKNDILQKFLNNFTEDFKEKYVNELNDIQDLNKIIDITDFKDTKEIIEKNFKAFF